MVNRGLKAVAECNCIGMIKKRRIVLLNILCFFSFTVHSYAAIGKWSGGFLHQEACVSGNGKQNGMSERGIY